MSGGRKKRLKEIKQREKDQKNAQRAFRQANPTGGSKYAKKGAQPFNERVAAEEKRRAAQAAETGPGNPTNDFDIFGGDDDGFDSAPSYGGSTLRRDFF